MNGNVDEDSNKECENVCRRLYVPAAACSIRPKQTKSITIAVFMARRDLLYLLIVLFSSRMTMTIDAMNAVALQ